MKLDAKIALRKALLTNLEAIPGHETIKDDIMRYNVEDDISELDKIMASAKGKVLSLKPLNIRILVTKLPVEDCIDVSDLYTLYLNDIIPRVNNFLYIKLETGGFAGYDTRIGKLGSAVFPILRLTIRHKNALFDRYIKPNGSEQYISDSTKEYLTERGVLDNAMKSPHTISSISSELEEWFVENNIPTSNVGRNIYTSMVAANGEFNMAFIKSNIPVLRNVLSHTVVNINHTLAALASSGVSIRPMSIYSDDAEEYVKRMQIVHSKLITGLKSLS